MDSSRLYEEAFPDGVPHRRVFSTVDLDVRKIAKFQKKRKLLRDQEMLEKRLLDS